MLQLVASLLLLAAAPAPPAEEPPRGRITGIGGIFFKAKDPKALAAWYRDVLGLALERWGGATLAADAPGHPPVLVWNDSLRSSLPFTTFTLGVGYSITDAREFRLDEKLWPKPSAWPSSWADSSDWRRTTMSRWPAGMPAPAVAVPGM